MGIRVKPIEDDISIISFNTDEVKIDKRERDKETTGDSLKTGRAGPQKGSKYHSSRCTKFLATWSSTLPDAVGITGIQYIVSNQDHILRRFVWLLALFGGFAAASYQTIDRTIYFLSNPKSVDYEIKYISPLEFPAVTVCNYNSYRNAALFSNVTYHPFAFLLSEVSNAIHTQQPVNYSYYETYLTDVNTTEMYLQLAHEMEYSQMLIVAYWDGWGSVTSANFTRVITDFGVCYTFNAGQAGQELLKQKVAGKGHGLSLMLDAQQYFYFYSSKALQVSAGFVVAIHNQSEVPQVDSLGVGVAPGTEVRIGLKRKEAINLEPPHGECGSKELKYFSSYSINSCRQECLTDFVLEGCGCVEPYMAVPSDLPVCNPAKVFSCVYTETERFNSDGVCECPIPCQQTTYTTSLSFATFPSDFYIQTLVNLYSDFNVTPEYFSSNTLKIEIYYEELSVESMEQQEAYTFFALLCDLGGALGLWLGGSILTFVEILDHFGHTAFLRGTAFQHS
ncbi:acid-sensing ion channel 1C-like [Acanthaster planci]|uniref:Acid-sensing ion channel 1C-like n=1 Tax=Acanthaster planci TaxID=133434 RepID=A0A8B7ZP18_ACAPL|nr:acid-sensing ion channel 1C-like [Acanthaster planci]